MDIRWQKYGSVDNLYKTKKFQDIKINDSINAIDTVKDTITML